MRSIIYSEVKTRDKFQQIVFAGNRSVAQVGVGNSEDEDGFDGDYS